MMKPDERRLRSYGLYIPKIDLGISKAAGIAGKEIGADMVLLHYEEPGMADNIRTFEQRVMHAAGRLDEDYPTSKMIGAYASDVLRVGTVEHVGDMSWVISEVTHEAELTEWAGTVFHVGGTPEQHEKRRIKELTQ